jgi:flagellar hook protein FlgE
MSALSSSLLTGLSGLVANQTELSVVGNNIANANTTAFKSSQVQFTPQFYVTDDTGSEPNSTFGGTDPSQVGLGTEVAQISQNLSQGELSSTGIASDLAINGNGYFVIQPAGQTGGQPNYTRDGAFTVNAAGQLVDSQGDFVMGYNANSNFQVNTNGALSPILIPQNAAVAQATSTATLTGYLTAGTAASAATTLTSQTFVSSTGTLNASTPLVDLTDTSGNPLFTSGDDVTVSAQVGTQAPTTQTFNVTGSATVGDYESFLNTTLGIVPPSVASDPAAGVSIQPATGGVAGSGTLQIIGNVGTVNSISITGNTTTTAAGGVDTGLPFSVDAAAQNGGVANGTSYATSQTVYDSLGNALTLNVNAVESSTSDSGTTWEYFVSSPDNIGGSAISSGTLNFNTAGDLISATGTNITLDRAGTGAQVQQAIDLNFNGVNGLGTSLSGTNLTMNANGYKAGTINGYSIGTDGVITGTFTNGLNETVGQIALANFANPSGLNNLGNNNYSVGPNSGAATVSTPGSGATGTLVSGSLEMSNVDLSQEFINLIIASTGYDASSRVISTGDQLLTELLSSQR